MDKSSTRQLVDLAMTDRRSFHRLLAGLGLSAVSLPVAARRAHAAGDLTYFTWAGYELPEFHPQFIDKYGASPDIAFFENEEDALSKLRSGYAPDIAHPCSSSVMRWHDADVIKALDVERLEYWPDIIPALKDIPGTSKNGQTLFVPIDWGSNSIAYRTDLVDPSYGEEPSWELLFDERYKDRVAMWDSVDGAIAMAAAIAGIADTANPTEDETAEIADILARLNEQVLFYWGSETDAETALASGEIVASYLWTGPVNRLRDDGLPVDYMFRPKEGVVSFCCGLVLTQNGTADEAAAYDFINAWSSPEAGQYLIEAYGYGHSNSLTYDLVSEDVLQSIGLGGDVSAFLSETSFFQYWPPEARERWISLYEGTKLGLTQ